MAIGDAIIVDDKAFTLTDLNQWTSSGIHREFHSSNIVATQAGASWTYEFIVTVSFFIDGVKIQDYASSGYFPQDTRHQTFFRSIDHLKLDPAVKHTLQVTQQNLPSAGRLLYFDYLLYTASDYTPIDKVTTRAFIDEREATFTGNGSPGQIVPWEGYFRGTVTKLSRRDQILTLPFYGTQVEIYGCTTESSPTHLTTASFSINRKVKQEILSSPIWEERLNTRLYTFQNLDPGEQDTLTIQWESGPPLCIDYFLITPVSNTSLPIVSAPCASAKSPTPVGEILAGGFGVLFLVFLGIFLWREKFRNRRGKVDYFHIDSQSRSALLKS
ncbi:hypothetical protein DL96DRAFT_1586253 [Flagelloscypha sp. PMI_526]|nr:hypothetical protein DL96DRAFT_1586253 [Flagelloscypha sp. PMI_526]